MNRSTKSFSDVAPVIMNHETALGTFHDQSFEVAQSNAYDYVLISAWDDVLNQECA